jgi:hypothetical protein
MPPNGGIETAKRALSYADVEVLGAFELPSRELMGRPVKVTVGDVTIIENRFNHIVEVRRFCADQVTVLGSVAECEITSGRGKHQLRFIVPFHQEIGHVPLAPDGGVGTIGEGICICL